jgi:epoxyqueuosine reductase
MLESTNDPDCVGLMVGILVRFSMMKERMTQALLEKGRSLGFTGIGVSEARGARRLHAYHTWLDNDYHGRMDYMARPDRIARRDDLNVILPGVRSIVSVALNYRPPGLPDRLTGDPSRGRISNYAWGADYHKLMEEKLGELADWLSAQVGGNSTCRVYVDTGAILERDHGESAGLGFTGKNTMLINPGGGSFFFLGEILTTAELEPTNENTIKMPGCGTCSRCLDACPTGAFPTPYVLDARRCISYLTIELKGWIPRELRPLMGNLIYGCDICQDVCPFNRFSEVASERAFWPKQDDFVAPPLLAILTMDEEDILARFAGSPIRRIGRVRLLRNACVAAGNWRSSRVVPALESLLHDPEPVLRGHSAWALGQIGGRKAVFALTMAHKGEYDARVRNEIVDCL